MATNNPDNMAQGWLKAAKDDERSCEAILREQHGSPNTVCFLSQQMAEKLLKAYCIELGGTFPKVHQLDALVKIVAEKDENVVSIKEEALLLTGFYVTARYPGDYEEYVWQDAKEAFDAAKKIKSFIAQRLSMGDL